MQNIKNTCFSFLLLGLLWACSQPQNTTSVNTASTPAKIQTVEVVQPQKRSFTAEVLISGTAQPNQKVMLYAMESGVVTQIRKDIGDKVNRGEVVAVLDNPTMQELVAKATSDLAVSRAKIKTAEAGLVASKAKAKGLQSIATRLSEVAAKTPQLTTIVDVETAQANAAEANAMIQSKEAYLLAQQETIQSMEVNLQTAKKRSSFLSIKAPFSGIITKRLVDKGSLLQSGMNQKDPQAIVEIQETNPVRITLPVPESDAVAIKKGMDVTITFPELSGEVYQAKITRTAGVLDAMSKTMQVEIDLANADGKIITGMYAKAQLQLSSRSNILSLPVNAKVRYKNEDYVLVVSDNKVSRVPVKIGLSDKDFFEVLNSEITTTTQVITNGKGLVNPGQQVEAILK